MNRPIKFRGKGLDHEHRIDEDYRRFVEWAKKIDSTIIYEEPLGKVDYCLPFRREHLRQPRTYRKLK